MAEIDIDGGVPATTLNGAINASVTSIIVTDGTGWPTGASGDFYAVIDRGLSTQEVVQCSARTSNTLTVTRGADGSTAASHADTADIEHIVPALTLQEANSHANATTGTPHGTAYLTPTAHTAIEHTTAMIADDAVTDAKLAASGLDISRFTTGTSDRDTTGNAATATYATTVGAAGVGKTSWTPQLYQGGNVTSTNNGSFYVRLGDLFIVTFNITATAGGTASQKWEIRDLPSSQASGTINGFFSLKPSGGTYQPGTLIEGAADGVYFVGGEDPFGQGGFLGSAEININVTSGDILRGQITYFVGS